MNWKRILVAACAIGTLLAPGCAKAPEQPSSPSDPGVQTVSFLDGLGRSVAVERPERVAALIGSFADIWCLAGGQETLAVAADDAWTSFNLGLSGDVVNLGGVKEPNLELLLSVQPDLVLASCNTEADVELLDAFEQAGIPAAYFDIQSFDDYLQMLKLCTQVEAALARQNGEAPRILCMRATGSSCKVKGSTDFLLGEMLASLGCVNVADGSSLLEDLSLEAIIAADPDYIFAVLQGADPARAQATLESTLLENPAWNSLRAVQEGRFYTLDHALYNLKPNARWGEAYEKLAQILYPE